MTTPPEQPKKRPRVLIADDVSMIRLQVEKMLAGLGYDAVHARDGVEAAHIILRGPEPLFAAILDLNMPKMKGVELIALLKKQQCKVPIFVTSAELSRETLIEVGKLGVHGVFSKPIRINHLQEKLLEVTPKPKKKIGFFCKRNESIALLGNVLNEERYELVWVDDFTRSNEDFSIRVFCFGFQDRNFEELLNSVPWGSFGGSKFLIGTGKIIEHCQKTTRPFDKVYTLPVDFTVLKTDIEALS